MHPFRILSQQHATHKMCHTLLLLRMHAKELELTAITTHARLTYGLILSPTLAAFHMGLTK